MRTGAAQHSSRRTSGVARVLAILRCFSRDDAPLSASEIARRTDIPQPTVWRYCRTLQDEGFLTVDTSGNLFSPGIDAMKLGLAALARVSLGELARPYFVDLADRFSGVAGLAILDGLKVRYVQRYQSPRAKMSYNIKLGWSLPILKASAGWALVAVKPDAERDALIAELKLAEPELWVQHGAGLMAQIAAFAQASAVVTVDVLHEGLTSAATPLSEGPEGAVYALYVTGSTPELSPRVIETELLPHLREAGAALSVILRNGGTLD